jgi:hypothetical protein
MKKYDLWLKENHARMVDDYLFYVDQKNDSLHAAELRIEDYVLLSFREYTKIVWEQEVENEIC